MAVSPSKAFYRTEVISGMVVNASGAAVAGATVSAQRLHDVEGDRPAGARTISDHRGRFALEHLTAGLHELTARHFHAGSVASVVSTDSKTVRIAIPSPGRLLGQILAADGRPAREYRVELVAGGSAAPDHVQRVLDAEGRFTFEGLGPGRYAVRADAPDGSEALAWITVASDVEHRLEALRMGHGLTVAGRLVDERGRPVAGATVRTAHHRGRAISGRDGRFSVGGVALVRPTYLQFSSPAFVTEYRDFAPEFGTMGIDAGTTTLMRGNATLLPPAGSGLGLILRSAASSSGTSVRSVLPGQAGQRAGLRPGDHFLRINRKDVRRLGRGAVHRLLSAPGLGGIEAHVRNADGTPPRRIVLPPGLSPSAEGGARR